MKHQTPTSVKNTHKHNQLSPIATSKQGNINADVVSSVGNSHRSQTVSLAIQQTTHRFVVSSIL